MTSPVDGTFTGSIKQKRRTRAKEDQFVFPICDEIIMEASEKKVGDDAVECNGKINVQRGCTEVVQASARRPSAPLAHHLTHFPPFFCPQCRLDR